VTVRGGGDSRRRIARGPGQARGAEALRSAQGGVWAGMHQRAAAPPETAAAPAVFSYRAEVRL